MEPRHLFEKKIVDALLDLDLTEYEAKTYISLVSKGRLNVLRISQLTGIPRERVYDALSSLKAKGWSELVSKHPMEYEAVAPDLALERTRNKILQKLKQRENEALSGLLMLYEQRFQISTEYTRVIFLGKPNVLSKINKMIEIAKAEMVIEALPIWTLSYVIENLRTASEKDVEIRILGSALDYSDLATLNELIDFAEVRCEKRARIHGAIIRDKDEVLQISFTPKRHGRLDGLNITKPIDVQGFLEAFDFHWRESQKIRDSREFKRIHQKEMEFTRIIGTIKKNQKVIWL